MFRKAKALGVALIVLLGGIAAAPGAVASEPRFVLSSASGIPGASVVVSAVDPCPEAEYGHRVDVLFTDASGVVTTIAPHPRTGSDGVWAAESFRIPSSQFPGNGSYVAVQEAAQGIGTFTARCVDELQDEVTRVYESVVFSVTGSGPRIAAEPKVARPGEVVTLSSNYSCLSGQPTVTGAIRGKGEVSFSVSAEESSASWMVQVLIPHTYYHYMWGNIPFPAGTYVIEAMCGTGGSPTGSTSFAHAVLEIRTEPVRYVALGDSFSSGLGTFEYIDPNYHCSQSTSAYAHLVAAEMNLGSPSFKACAGAVTHDFLYDKDTRTPAQIDHLATVTEEVSLTIGGNDVLFAEVVDACVARPNSSTGNCAQNTNLQSRLTKRLSILAGTDGDPMSWGQTHPLIDVYQAIHGRAPAAKVYVAGYPNLFGENLNNYAITPVGYQCWLAGPLAYITYADALWLNLQAQKLNRVIREAVRDAQLAGIDITYVPPDSFDGHGVCDREASWLNGLVLDGWNAKPESMHPTKIGHEQGYKEDFVAIMGE